MFEGSHAYESLSPEEKIRIAVRELAVLSALDHADMSRFCEPGYQDDAPEIIARWTGVDPRTMDSGLEIIIEEATLMRAAFTGQ